MIAVGVSSAFCSTFTARAETGATTEPPAPWTRQIAVEGQLGTVGAPLGFAGLAIDADVRPWLSVSAGVSPDLFAPEKNYTCPCPGGRNHAALMARLRRPILGAATFLAIGVGLSRSSTPDGDAPNVIRQDDELALEHRFDDGLRLRAFAGVGVHLRGPSGEVGDLYAGAALGYALAPNPEQRSAYSLAWYGWQPGIADTIAAILIRRNREDPHVFPTAIALYGLTAPIVHVAHHNYRRAVLSGLLRAALPLLAFGAGGSDASSSDTNGLMAVGGIAAALIDDLAMAWDL